VLLPKFTAPGELTGLELRAMWSLRLSLLPLRPEIDPETDFAKFCSFVSRAHVARLCDGDRPMAMFCYQTEDGELAGTRYRMAAFEYGFVAEPARGHPGVALCYLTQLVGCRSLAPGVRNYFLGCGYPRSFVLLERALPQLRFDGEPELDALERHLIERFVERHVGANYDHARRLVRLPTSPPPLDPSYRERYCDDPILRRYEARAPDWERSYALIGISRFEGGNAKLAREVLGRWRWGLRQRLRRPTRPGM
jgi:hypothetical protein